MNDAIIPYGLKISQGTRHVMASMVIRSISKEIKDTNIVKELQWAGGKPANGSDLNSFNAFNHPAFHFIANNIRLGVYS